MIKMTIEGKRFFLSKDEQNGVDFVASTKTLFGLINESPGKVTIRADMRGVPTPNAAERKRFAEIMKANSDILESKIAGWAIVYDSRLIVGVTTAIDWFLNTKLSKKHFVSLEEADKWLDACESAAVVKKAPKPKTKQCPYCKGKKTLFTTKRACLSCDGTGEVSS